MSEDTALAIARHFNHDLCCSEEGIAELVQLSHYYSYRASKVRNLEMKGEMLALAEHYWLGAKAFEVLLELQAKRAKA